jgi:enoyl-CoA hydratase/carnithine racemase
MTATEPEDNLLCSVSGGIGRITFNRPQVRKAVTFAMYERLAEICQTANADRSIKVLILTGAGMKRSPRAPISRNFAP